MKTKTIAGILSIAAAGLAIYSYMALPQTVAVQIGVDGEVTNTMPKLFAVALPWVITIGGCGAAVLNTHFGRTFLPVGKPFGIFKK